LRKKGGGGGRFLAFFGGKYNSEKEKGGNEGKYNTYEKYIPL